MRRNIWAVAILALTAAGMTVAVHGQSLPAGKADTPDSLRLLAEDYISKAAKQRGEDLDAFDRSMVEAEKSLTRAVAMLPKAARPEEQLASFRVQLRLVDATGIIHAEPYANRLMFLQGGEIDRRKVLDLTAEPIKNAEALIENIDGLLQSLREKGKERARMLLGPPLEDLKNLVQYKTGWIHFYRGMAMGESMEKERRALLSDAANYVKAFDTEMDDSGVKYWSVLLMGMCQRELKDYHKAGQFFQMALSAQAAAPIRLQAGFEISRAAIEAGKFEQAKAAIQSYQKLGYDMQKDDGRIVTDLNAALLTSYLYECRATREPGKAEEHLAASQKAIVDFATKYPSQRIQNFLYEVISARFGGDKDFSKLNSLICFSVARQEMLRKTPQSLDRAMELLDLVLGRSDAVSVSLRPEALLKKAMILNERKMNIEAAAIFMEIVAKHPDSPNADNAALFAVESYYGIVADRISGDKPVGLNIRDGFVRALDALLARPVAAKTDVQAWNYYLGDQCEKLGDAADAAERKAQWYGRAVAAFEKVPTALPNYMESRHWALEAAVKKIEALPQAERSREASVLLMKLNRFLDDAKAAERSNPQAASIREWSALAEFRVAYLYDKFLNRQDEAMRMLQALPDKWSGAAAAWQSQQYEIDRLVNLGKTGDAIERVEKVLKERPDEAEHVLLLVISNVRSTIDSLYGKPRGREELTHYRQVYLQFAEELFNRVRGKPVQDRLRLTQMYADALVENERGDEALTLFQDCRRLEEQAQAALAKRVDDETNARIAAVKEAGKSGDAEAMTKLARQYLSDFTGVYQFKVQDSAYASGVKSALDYLAVAKPEDADRRRANLSRWLTEAYENLRAIRKRSSVDATTVRGLARAYRQQKEFAEAMKYYHQCVQGIDKAQYPRLYWQAELEYCQTILDGLKQDKARMRELTIRIQQLKADDKDMGGLLGQFDVVENEASKAAGGRPEL